MAEALVWAVMGLTVGAFGYIINVGKRYDLIAGYEPSRHPHPEVLGGFVGGMLLKEACLLFALAILRALLPGYAWALRIALFCTFAWLLVALLTGARRRVQE